MQQLTNKLENNLNRIAFLDGLRGWGSLFVLNGHLFSLFLFNPFLNLKIISYKIPFIFDGKQAVYLFFIVSGFALSFPFFKNRNNRRIVLEGLIRRYPRLSIPIFFSAFITWFLLTTDLMYNLNVSNLIHSERWIGTFFLFEPSILSLIKFSFFDVYFEYKNSFSYNPVLWTMQIELIGSIAIYFFLLFFGKSFLRFIVYISALYFLYQTAYVALVLGVMLSDFYCLKHSLFKYFKNKETIQYLFSTGLFVMGLSLWIFNTNNIFEEFISLNEHLKFSIIGFFLLCSCLVGGPLESFFSSKFSTKLGKYSFPIYLVHVPIICSFSSWFYLFLDNYEINYLVKIIINGTFSLFLIFLIAYYFEKYIEKSVIFFVKSISDKFLRRVENYRK